MAPGVIRVGSAKAERVWRSMVNGNYRELFAVIATSAATLIGLLFVALSIAESRPGQRPKIVRQFRAAASFLAFVNALAVSMFALVPGTNVGIPAFILGVTGLLFTAAGIRTTFQFSVKQNLGSRQPVLVVLLLVMFGFELGLGLLLTIDVNRTWVVGDIGNVLIVSLLIGIARAWELVADWNTGILSSITLLFGSSAEIKRAAAAERDDRSAADEPGIDDPGNDDPGNPWSAGDSSPPKPQ
jgi:hypothetical protein